MLTTKFLANVDADFADDECKSVNFKSIQWKYPLEALKAMQIQSEKKKDEHIRLDVYFDLEEANRILKDDYGSNTKLKKDMYKIKFVDLNTLRDFVFHLKRLYHMHRLSKVARDKNRTGP